MNLEIEVRYTTELSSIQGSVQWLLANIGYISIGLTKKGNQGAWLMNKNGKLLTVLALRNYEKDDTPGDLDGTIYTADNKPNYPDWQDDYDSNYDLFTTIHFTEKAYRVIRAITLKAVDEMKRLVGEGELEEVFVELKRTKDPTAIGLAINTLADPEILPILTDRLKELS